MKSKIKCIIIVLFIVLSVTLIYILKKNTFSVNTQIGNYKLSNPNIKDKYLNYLKKYITVHKLTNFIQNDYVALSPMNKATTGKEVIQAMEFIGYKMLFISMFDKNRINFDDCPVTSNFKHKFNTNLLHYFNLNASDDCDINCLLNREDKELIVEVYGNLVNTEPTYGYVHRFHYTLDSEGNVDDIVYDDTE